MIDFEILESAKILAVEDSPEYQLLIKDALGSPSGLLFASSISEANSHIQIQTFDMILLDVVLPDGLGYSLCESLLKSNSSVPVIFLSSKSDLSDKVLGLSLGAEDYISKPFEPMELKARVANKLTLRAASPESMNSSCGNLVINLDSMTAKVLMKSGPPRDLNLTSFEFKLLLHLSKNIGVVQTRNMLLDSVWGTENHVSDRTVDSSIAGLRKKIKDWNYTIRTIYGAGYIVEASEPEHCNYLQLPQPALSDFLATSSLKDSRDLYTKVADLFLNEWPSLIAKLGKAIESESLEEAWRILHRLAGSVANFSKSGYGFLKEFEDRASKGSLTQDDLNQVKSYLEELAIKIQEHKA
ncbi:MAG: response regulator [Bdellovibrionales bacterium]|nr:response regulator [Bdellovibrionales bacterium]